MQAISDRFIRTLGIRTDLELNVSRSQIEECGDHLVVRTPQNPGYYFGNYLIYDRAPESGDAHRWLADFEAAFTGDSQVRHAAFAFGASPEPDGCAEFERAGFTFEDRAVMRCANVVRFDPPAGVRIAPLTSNADWASQLEMQMAARPEVHDESLYRTFKERQIEHHREITQTRGVWFGAFEGPRLAGSCGIFRAGAFARYQDVTVHPQCRNRGIARALVSRAGAFALEHWDTHALVIVAKREAFARRIYGKCGFVEYQREAALWKARRA